MVLDYVHYNEQLETIYISNKLFNPSIVVLYIN